MKDNEGQENTSEMSKGIQVRLERIESLLAEIKATANKLLDLEEAAAYIHNSKSHLYRLTSRGLITHFKPAGKKIYFLKQDLDTYLLRHRRPAAEEVEATAASYVVNHPAAKNDRLGRTGPFDGRPGRQAV